VLLNVHDYRREALRRVPRIVRDYVEGGAEDEQCLHRNARDLAAVQLVPRVLCDTSKVDLSVTVFGRRWPVPLAVAPIGLAGMVHPLGDRLLARGAAARDVPFVLSTASNNRIEDVRSESAGKEQWMQLYVMGERKLAEQIVVRARSSGYSALVLTVDVPVGGSRERDQRNGFSLPLKLRPAVMADLLLHPRWLLRMARHGAPQFLNLSAPDGSANNAQAQAALLARTMDRALVWESLSWLRRLWDGPLLVKGILHEDDAVRALRHGVDGLIVSNHGGRQLDVSPSSISVLERIVRKVDGRIPVLMDSGIRRGSDIAKALALGATAVLVGRPALYGLACNGADGVSAVLGILEAELERTIILLGATTVGELPQRQLISAGESVEQDRQHGDS